MSRSNRTRREAENTARRALRLARRMEERAKRKEEQADRALERAERLAESVRNISNTKPESTQSDEDEYTMSRKKRHKRKRDRYDSIDTDFEEWWDTDSGYGVKPKRRRFGHLYRDSRNGKILGVCAGVADYLRIQTWKIRAVAVVGLVFIAQITLPLYVAAYFILNDKPYYRRVTDRFDDMRSTPPGAEDESLKKHTARKSNRNKQDSRRFNNVRIMRSVKKKFTDLERRIRNMETCVTSSRFELQREFNGISGEETF